VRGDFYSSGNIYLEDNKHIYIKDTNSTNRDVFRLSSSNNLLVGYGNCVSGGTYIYGKTVVLYYHNGSARTSGLAITNAGKVGIGTNSPSTKLHVSGDVTCTSLT
jgi:hypothetical protein